jgi:hypothetical protein
METQTVTREQQWSEPNTSRTAVAIPQNGGVGLVSPQQTRDWADIFRKSGLFAFEGSPEVQLAQAQVKILAGAEMGLQPFFAMQQLYIVKGHIFVSAMAYGALINQPDPDGFTRRKYKTVTATADKAVIEFYRLDSVSKQWELALTQTYTWEEVPAARRNNPTYTSDRPDMIWNRCMTKGGRKFAPEKVGGIRTLEDAADEGEWREEKPALIPETVEAAPNVAAKTPPEIAAGSPTTVAGTSEPAPKRKRATKNVDATASESVVTPADEQVDVVDDMVGGQDDIADELVSADQVNIMRDWILGEKFDLEGATKRHGFHIKTLDATTQGQFHTLQEDRDAYIRECAEAFGWTLDGLKTTHEHRKQLQERAAKNLRRA